MRLTSKPESAAHNYMCAQFHHDSGDEYFLLYFFLTSLNECYVLGVLGKTVDN